MTKRIALALATVVLGALALAGCTPSPPPCSTIPAPTAEEARVDALPNRDLDYEFPDGRAECDLVLDERGNPIWTAEPEERA